MIEVVKRKADYAENQTKFLLKDLNNQNNSVRMKGIKAYQEYIETYRPDMYDDDVDHLFLGDPQVGQGLLHWSGSQSTKHGGQLKRIAANVISLIRFLISMEDNDFGNIFFERFMRLPLKSLREINFVKHILPEGSTGIMSSSARLGNTADACEILSLIVQYHVDENGDPDPVDLLYMCNDNAACKDYFVQWFQETAREEMLRNIAARSAPKVVKRANQWSEVSVRAVPLQADENEGEIEDKDDDEDLYKMVPDPLGLNSVDLKATQAMHLSGMGRTEATRAGGSGVDRRSSNPVMKLGLMQRMQEGMKHVAGKMGSDNQLHSPPVSSSVPEREENLDEDEDDEGDMEVANSRYRHTTPIEFNPIELGSVLPSDKNFKPELFLSLVHGTATKNDLTVGLQNLEVLLNQQSTRRRGLVRQHYGLFMHCVDGLEWLKAYHENTASDGSLEPSVGKGQSNAATSASNQRKKSILFGAPGTGGSILQKRCMPPPLNGDKASEVPLKENRMLQAKHYLELAKKEAHNTLAPILSRMSRSRQVKNADQILRRLVSTLEYPYAMQQTLSQGDYEGVLNIYRRVQSLPATSGLRILKRVSSRADAIVVEMKQKILATILAPTPVFSILPRMVKLIRELEDADTCRNVLQQCFEKQMEIFEDSVRTVGMKFSEGVMRAYMKGQEINMMNKDQSTLDGERKIATEVPSHSKSLNESARLSSANGPNREQRRSQIMEALNVFESDTASVRSDNSSHIGGENRRALLIDDFDDDDLDYRSRGDLDAMSDAGSVHSNDSSNQARDRPSGGRKAQVVEEEWLNDPDVDYSEVLCAKVRMRTCRSLIEIIDRWLPSVNRVLQVLTSAPSGGGGAPGHSSAAKSSLNSTSSGTPKKVIIGASAVTSAANLSRALNTTYGRNQSIAGPAKQLGDCLVSCADIMRGAILGFKSKTTAPIMAEISSKGIFSQDMMQNALKDPFLTDTVTEVSELYDVIETMLIGKLRSTRQDNSDDFDNINFFGSAAYRSSVVSLRAVAEDGENAVVKKSLEHLIASCLRHLSSSISGGVSITSGLAIDIADSGPVGKGRLGESSKQLTADELILAFENTVVACLNRLSDIVRRPEWVSSVVWDSIQRLLDRYIATLGVSAANSSLATTSESSPKANIAGGNSTVTFALDRADSVDALEVKGNIAGAQAELELLETSLTDSHHVQTTKDRSLDFIKACVHLRTRTVAKLWRVVQDLFPLDDMSRRSTSDLGSAGRDGQNRSSEHFTSTSDIAALARRKSRSGLGVFTYEDDENTGQVTTPIRKRSATQAAESNHMSFPLSKTASVTKEKALGDRIGLSVGSIAVIEENAVVKYLDMMLLYFRTNIHASFSIIVKAEMMSTWESVQVMASGGVPSHISKILLELEFIQAELFNKLATMTIPAKLGRRSGESKLFADSTVERAWMTDSTTYEDFLFHTICISVLDVYADLVESLAINAFSLHSTGRKPVSRRMSCSNVTSDGDFPAGPTSSTNINYSAYTCKYLLSCGQALEEFEFLQMAVQPIVLSADQIPVIRCKDHIVSQLRAKKKDGLFMSKRKQLWQETRLFVEAVRNKSSGRYAARHNK